MHKISRWLRRASEIGRRDGLRGLIAAVLRGFHLRAYNVWTRDHFWQGRLVEILGNRWRIDGVVVRVDDPSIATRHKALLLNGIYELPERRMLAKHMALDLPLIELGACIGVLACIANRRLKCPQEHLVVEANPRLIPLLTENKRMNRCKFQVVHAALAYSEDGVALFGEGSFTSGHVRSTGSVPVPARSLSELAHSVGFQTFDLICDIEGAEMELIERESAFLRSHVRTLLVEMHPGLLGEPAVNKLGEILASNGFDVIETANNVVCFINREHEPTP